MTRLRHDDVEQEIGAGFGEKRMDVARDERVGEEELGGAGLRALRVNVGKADDLQLGDVPSRLEPGFAHCATANEGGFQLHGYKAPRLTFHSLGAALQHRKRLRNYRRSSRLSSAPARP